MERLNEAISAQIEASDGNNSHLEYGASQGYGIFYAKEDYPSVKERMPLEQVIELADKRMYYNKNQYKKEHPEPINTDRHNSARAKVLYQSAVPELIDDNAKA